MVQTIQDSSGSVESRLIGTEPRPFESRLLNGLFFSNRKRRWKNGWKGRAIRMERTEMDGQKMGRERVVNGSMNE